MAPAQASITLTPQRPIPAVIAVLVRGDEVLLVRRAHRPDAGRWGFPGGKIELGESVLAAAARELYEETQVRAEPCQSFTTLDVFDRDEDGSLRQQFVLVAVLCAGSQANPMPETMRWMRAGSPSQSSPTLTCP